MNPPGCPKTVLISATLAALFAAHASAADLGGDSPSGIPEGSIAEKLPTGLADPGGVRRGLGVHGIVIGATYTGEVLGNFSGGLKQSTHYDGLLELYTDIEMIRLIGWKGLDFHASWYEIHGTSISGENIGGLASVSNIEAFPSSRLFELWFEQKLFDEMLSIRFGQVAADAEFFASDLAGNLFNSTFGWTTISSGNLPVGGPIYPIATPGVRLAFNPNDNFGFMIGAWNGDPVGPCPDDKDPGQCNEHGLDFRLEDPPLMLAEGAHKYNQEGTGLPGIVKIGGWYHFGDFDDLRRDQEGGLIAVTGGAPLRHDGNHGIYAVWEQMVYRLPGYEDAKGISFFTRIAGSPGDRNQIDFYLDGAFNFTGFLSSRPNDVLAVGVAYSRISDDASAFDRDSGETIVHDFETVLEVSYTAEVVPGLTLQPDFQYFWNPGAHVPDDTGSAAVEDAAIFGVRTNFSY
jgi:porin